MKSGRCANCQHLTVGWVAYASCARCGEVVSLQHELQDQRNELQLAMSTNKSVAGAKAWEKLHAMENPSQEKIANWLANDVPKYSCDCAAFATEYIANNPPPLDDGFFEWTWRFHDAVDQKTGDERMSLEDAKKFWRINRGVQYLVTYDELTRDTARLAELILEAHPDVSGIAGVPRSGMRCASDVALRLGVPLYEASVTNGLRYMAGGSRIRRKEVHGERKTFDGPVVLVDDSICSGYSLSELKANPEIADLPFYVVYGASPGRHEVNGYAVHLELPHWFDWNLLSNGQILRDFNLGIDFDGVLCEDCSVQCDDDGECYLNWIQTVKAIRTPRDFVIPFIVTARLEKYRNQTEAWLAKHRISYGRLVMFPGTFADRQKTCVGGWKADRCVEHNIRLFVESSYDQSLVISQKTQVISIERRSCAVCGQPATRICSHTSPFGMCGERLCESCEHKHAL